MALLLSVIYNYMFLLLQENKRYRFLVFEYKTVCHNMPPSLKNKLVACMTQWHQLCSRNYQIHSRPWSLYIQTSSVLRQVGEMGVPCDLNFLQAGDSRRRLSKRLWEITNNQVTSHNSKLSFYLHTFPSPESCLRLESSLRATRNDWHGVDDSEGGVKRKEHWSVLGAWGQHWWGMGESIFLIN